MEILIEPSFEYENEYLEMCFDYIHHNDGEYIYDTIEAVRKKITSDIQYKLGLIPKDRLQSFSYWLMENGKIIGTSRLRPQLNERFYRVGGHIGYDIAPSYRRKGYGTKLLALTLEKARALGLREVLITCDDDNIGSRKIIANNKGILKEIFEDEITKKKVRRYHIGLD